MRFEGNFPVGTFENRQTYTVRLKKDLKFDGVTIPVVLTATYDYWNRSNVCPGLKGHETEWQNGSVIGGSGIDLVLGSSSKYYGRIEINKKVAGLTLTQNMTYQFQVKDSNGKIVATPECVVSPNAVNPDGSYFGTCVADMVPYGTYTIVEVTPDDVEGYDLTPSTNKEKDQVTLSAENTPAIIEVTNTYTAKAPTTTSIPVEKVWNDGNNQDKKRPEKITVNLYAVEGDDKELKDYKDVTPDEGGNWSCTFADLPKYADDEEIVYTVDEERVEGYISSVAKNEDGSFTITNTETTSISVTKAWDDDNDRDKIRPDSVTVQLKIGENEVDGQTLVLNNDNKWTDSFDDLPKYDEAGNLIDYTVQETGVSKDYTPKITGTMADGFTITNTYTPETTSITVKKEWKDNDNQDNIRPNSVTVQLFADGQLVEDNELTLSESNNWEDSFTNLPKYENGVEINYSVKEVETKDLEGYNAKVEST